MSKVLIIDDDAVYRIILKTSLSNHGFEVIEAENGQEGVRFAQQSKPDLILSDLYMDEGDGYAVLRELARSDDTVSIPIIIMTGQVDVEAFRQSMNLGADDFLVKPFNDETLMLAVNARLKRQEQARLQSEQMLRLQAAALNAAANGIVITDLQGHILMVNQAFATMTGYSTEEVRGLNPRILKSGRHDDSFYRNMWESVLAGHVWHGELVNRRKNGTFYTEEMTITPVRDKQGRITHFIAIKRDITERRQIEERLRASQELYHSLIESLPVCLFRKDLEGRITFCQYSLLPVYPAPIRDNPGQNRL